MLLIAGVAGAWLYTVVPYCVHVSSLFFCYRLILFSFSSFLVSETLRPQWLDTSFSRSRWQLPLHNGTQAHILSHSENGLLPAKGRRSTSTRFSGCLYILFDTQGVSAWEVRRNLTINRMVEAGGKSRWWGFLGFPLHDLLIVDIFLRSLSLSSFSFRAANLAFSYDSSPLLLSRRWHHSVVKEKNRHYADVTTKRKKKV